jgi:hypothetical protein
MCSSTVAMSRPFTEVARETLDWLDGVLGPVAPGSP